MLLQCKKGVVAKGVDVKRCWSLLQCVVFGKLSGISSYFQKIAQIFGNKTESREFYQKNRRTVTGGSALFVSTPFFEMKSAGFKVELALKIHFRFLGKNVFGRRTHHSKLLAGPGRARRGHCGRTYRRTRSSFGMIGRSGALIFNGTHSYYIQGKWRRTLAKMVPYRHKMAPYRRKMAPYRRKKWCRIVAKWRRTLTKMAPYPHKMAPYPRKMAPYRRKNGAVSPQKWRRIAKKMALYRRKSGLRAREHALERSENESKYHFS